jgi:hypothetical protein
MDLKPAVRDEMRQELASPSSFPQWSIRIPDPTHADTSSSRKNSDRMIQPNLLYEHKP